MNYIADITVNGHPETVSRPKPPVELKLARAPAVKYEASYGTRNLLDEKGPKAVANWMLEQKRLLLTDTTMRDGHQSLHSTRMRSLDMIN